MHPFRRSFPLTPLQIFALVIVVFYLLTVLSLFLLQRDMLYRPTHASAGTDAAAVPGLSRWRLQGKDIGYVRDVAAPRHVWLALHGNAGQADRYAFILRALPQDDTVYLLEYPGYGIRPGSPSKDSLNAAAFEAYSSLAERYGADKIGVVGESLGSGPASMLAQAPQPPARIVLLVPFDVLSSVIGEYYPSLPVSLLLRDNWNNIEALKNYTGSLDIYGGTRDKVIPVQHARNLARALPGAKYHEFFGGHFWFSAGVQVEDVHEASAAAATSARSRDKASSQGE